jgi:rare lipoprotein A
MRSLAGILLCCLAASLAGCGDEAVRPASGTRTVAAARPASAVTRKRPPAAQQPPAWQSLPTWQPDHDGPPEQSEIPPDLASVPDAVPQAEPMSITGNPDSYEVYGDRYVVLKNPRGYKERGYASWYGKKFHGKRTSSGEPYDMFKMTAAHKTLPIPCYARVTNLDNGKNVVVRINDRGPFHDGRIIDLSYTAAVKLGSLDHGSIPVEVEALEPGQSEPRTLLASATPAPQQTMYAAPSSATAAPVVIVPAVAAAPPVQQVVMNAPLVEAPRAPAVAVPAAAEPTIQYLQAGSFKDPSNAATLREQLNEFGISNVRLISGFLNGNRVSRVLIGPFFDTDTLAAVRKHLSDLRLSSVPVLE